MRARRAGVAVLGLAVVTACGLQHTGVQGTVAADRLSADSGTQVNTTNPTAAGQTPGAVTDTGAASTDSGGSSSDTSIPVGPGSGPVVGPAQPGGGGAATTASGGSKSSPAKGAAKTTAGGLKGGSTKSTTAAGNGSASKLNGTLVFDIMDVGGFDKLAAGIPGINIDDEGSAADQAAALVAYVNGHGGIAGKALKINVISVNAQQASESTEQSSCATVRDTDHAFAVALLGQIHPETRQCYAAAKILMFEGSTYGWPEAFYKSNSPYQWALSYPSYDQAEKAKIASLGARKWFGTNYATAKVGVVNWDEPEYNDLFQSATLPALKSLGFLDANVDEEAVGDGDIQTIESGLQRAATKLAAEGITHVMFIGSAPLQPFFIEQSPSSDNFVYGLSSFDGPLYEQYNEASAMVGSMGIGFNLYEDVSDTQVSYPQPGVETTCFNIYKAANIAPPHRNMDNEGAKQAMNYCQYALWLKQVGDAVGPSVTQQSWAAKAEQLGAPFTGVFTFGSQLGVGLHHATSVYRDDAWDTSCSCYKYTSGNKNF